MKRKCYYDTDDCGGEKWECKTCGETFCEVHYHVTDKGRNVECCGCEHNAEDYARDYPTITGEKNEHVGS